MQKIMLPPHQPADEGVQRYLRLFSAVDQYPVRLLGVRGYYKKTLGNPDTNDTGIYDDAIFIVTPTSVTGYNANTDPSVVHSNTAILKEGGPYLYRIGLHNMKHPYKALRQYGNVTVLRNGVPDTDSPNKRFYIDIHKGGFGTTSSLGCQTIYPTQWEAFLKEVESELKIHNQVDIPYILTSNS